jgi:hypothetical protein
MFGSVMVVPTATTIHKPAREKFPGATGWRLECAVRNHVVLAHQSLPQDEIEAIVFNSSGHAGFLAQVVRFHLSNGDITLVGYKVLDNLLQASDYAPN